MANHEIWLTTDRGVRLGQLVDNLGGYFMRVANKRAPFMLRLPGSFRWKEFCRPDQMVQFWRQAAGGGAMSLWRSYFLRAWEPSTDASGETIVTLYGYDPLDLLRRRIVAAFAESDDAEATATEADDLMKTIVTDMESDIIPPTPSAGTRAWPNLSVQGDLVKGPQLTHTFQWDQILEELTELGLAAKAAGTEVFFDIVESNVTANSIAFEFRTTTGQPGKDLSDERTFSEQNKSLVEPSLLFDHRNEVNYVYAVGQGDAADAEVQQVFDATRYGASLWNRCEAYVYAGGEEFPDGVRERGRAELSRGRPRRIFSARTVDVDGMRLGRDYRWGDKLRAEAFGFAFDVIVRAVTISIDQDGTEGIDLQLRHED